MLPDREYLLQGSISDSHVEALRHRLRGLCDNVDVTIANQEQFQEREMMFVAGGGVYSTGPLSGSGGGAAAMSLQPQSPSPQRPTFHPTVSAPTVQLRLKRSMPPGPPYHWDPNDPALANCLPPWQLRYVGQPEVSMAGTKSAAGGGQGKPIGGSGSGSGPGSGASGGGGGGTSSHATACPAVRTLYDIPVSDNAVDFLAALGFRLDFEYISKGFVFHKGRIRITVCKIHRVPVSMSAMACAVGGNTFLNDGLEPVSRSHLVEMSVHTFSEASAGGGSLGASSRRAKKQGGGGRSAAPPPPNKATDDSADAIVDDMRTLADQLRPLVVLDRIDARRSSALMSH